MQGSRAECASGSLCSCCRSVLFTSLGAAGGGSPSMGASLSVLLGLPSLCARRKARLSVVPSHRQPGVRRRRFKNYRQPLPASLSVLSFYRQACFSVDCRHAPHRVRSVATSRPVKCRKPSFSALVLLLPGMCRELFGGSAGGTEVPPVVCGSKPPTTELFGESCGTVGSEVPKSSG